MVIQYLMVLLESQLLLDVAHIRFVNKPGMRQPELTLVALLGQDVTLEGMLSLNFTRARYRKPLLGTGFCLHFWHFSYLSGSTSCVSWVQ